jgi:hypothetical protein
MNIATTHSDVDRQSRIRSSLLWHKFNDLAVERSLLPGCHVFEDFTFHGLALAANQAAATAFTLAPSPTFAAFTGATAGSTITTEVSQPDGIISQNTPATDNNTVHLQIGPNLANAGWIVLDGRGFVAWEQRCAPSVVDTTNCFIGLALPSVATAAGVISDTTDATVAGLTAAVGWFKTAAGAWQPVYKNGTGTTWTEVGDPVAATTDLHKFGLSFDPKSGNPTRGLRFTYDGDEMPVSVPIATILGLTTLSTSMLTAVSVTKATAAAAGALRTDWIGAGQVNTI